MAIVEVVAGIIYNDSRTEVLLALRKPEQHQGDRWEFPGGKLESGESLQAGLIRELSEEIGIQVRDCRPRTIIEYSYPEKQVRLHFWEVTQFSGEPEGQEGQSLRWVPLTELETLDFPEANQAVVQALCAVSAC